MSDTYFSAGPPTAADAPTNEYFGHACEQDQVDAYEKPSHTALPLGHPLDRVTAADTYAHRNRGEY